MNSYELQDRLVIVAYSVAGIRTVVVEEAHHS